MRRWGPLLCMLLSSTLHAEGVITLSGPVRMLPGTVKPGMRLDGALPKEGRWLALTCAVNCALQPVALAAPRAKRAPFAATSTPEFSLDGLPHGRVIAFFDGLPGGARTPVTFLHADMEHYPDGGTVGTLEITVRGAAGEGVRIVPRLALHGRESDALKIYLEKAAVRQWLGSMVQPLQGTAELGPRDLLLWAGDLDGDGRIDLLMQFPSPAGGVLEMKLFLSGAATAGELVGEVGRYRQQASGD